jgi:hypothetical protein
LPASMSPTSRRASRSFARRARAEAKPWASSGKTWISAADASRSAAPLPIGSSRLRRAGAGAPSSCRRHLRRSCPSCLRRAVANASNAAGPKYPSGCSAPRRAVCPTSATSRVSGCAYGDGRRRMACDPSSCIARGTRGPRSRCEQARASSGSPINSATPTLR